MTAFYWARRQKLEIGESLNNVANADEKNWDFEIDVLRTQGLNLQGHDLIAVVLLEPKVAFRGILEKRGKVIIYLSADERRVPILIKLKIPCGPVIGVMADCLSRPGQSDPSLRSG